MSTQDPFAAYTVRKIPGAYGPRIDIAHHSELRSLIAAEIVALTGCDERIALIAGGAFANCPRADVSYGLADGSADGWEALYVLRQWVASVEARSAHRVAA